MLSRVLILGVFLIAGYSCALRPGNLTQQAPPPPTRQAYEFDHVKTRVISDSMVNALIENDRPALFSKMEKAAREYYDQASYNEIIDMMLGMFGSPVEAKFKKVEQGRKSGTGGYDKPVLKHWYAVRTSKFDYGSHFIFVEIVPEDNGYASSGISIVTFPMGVPDDMKEN